MMKMASRPRLRTTHHHNPLPPTREDGDDDGGGGESSSDDSLRRKKKSSKKKEKGTHKHKQPQKAARSSLIPSSSILPTIYAENRDSFTDVNGNHNNTHNNNNHHRDDDGSDNDSSSNNGEDSMPANKKFGRMTSTDDKDEQRRRTQKQDEFVPAQLQLKSNGKKKSSSSSIAKGDTKKDVGRSKKKSSSTKTSSTVTDASWDELGDEIASALNQSLMVEDGRPNNNDYTPTRKKAASSKQNSSNNNTTAVTATSNNPTNDDSTALPWKCPACTYKNEPLHLVCSVCGTAAIASINHHPHPPLTFSLNKSGGSSSNSARSSGHGNLLGSALYDSNLSQQQIQPPPPIYNHHQSTNMNRVRYHGSAENLTNYESLRRSNTTNPLYHHHPASNVDPHIGHRRMIMGRRQSDEISNDSNHNNNNEMGEVLRSSFTNEHRRRSRDYDYYERRRPSAEDYYRGSLVRRSTIEGRDGGGGGGRAGSVSSGRHRRTRSRRGGGGGEMYDDNDSLSRRSRNSRDDYHHRSNNSKDYRKSTMMDMDYGGGGYERGGGGGSSSVGGRYRGSRNRDEGGRYRDRDDYSEASESLGTKGRITGGKYYDDGSTISEMSDDEATLLNEERTVRTMQTIKKMVIPSGEVTIIYTDVQGSTALWEADPMSMKKATDIHDSIIRRCYSDHGGYEITTEGDAFNLAFQHPADAIGFALKAQLALYRAKWPEGTLKHPDGCDNEKKKFRGFRVRFGMHHGPTTSTVHKTTGRTTYQGEAVEIAKAIEKMSHGGQILTTVETWRTVSGMAEQLLGSPQVMDCGEHLLWDPKKSDLAKKKASSKKVLSKRIVQLVPNSLSYDFFAARGGQEVKEGEAPQKVCGRVFPPLLSHGQLSTSFLNAPYIGNKVAMVFVYTDKMEALEERERKKNYKILAKYVRSHLMRLSPPGYECQEDKGSWMLAFDRIDNGINFGLDLKENVMKNAKLLGDVDKSQVFRVGIHWGPFLSMGPHTVTGHADYFGPIVNRAARVAAQCEPGQVCVGVPMGTDEEPPDPGPTVEVDVLGVKQLKGISIEMAIFGCRKVEKKPEVEEDS